MESCCKTSQKYVREVLDEIQNDSDSDIEGSKSEQESDSDNDLDPDFEAPSGEDLGNSDSNSDDMDVNDQPVRNNTAGRQARGCGRPPMCTHGGARQHVHGRAGQR